MSVVYMEEITVVEVAMKVMYVFFVFVQTSLITIALLYISELHHKMKTFNVENVKLLDGMHEGLLILLKSDPKKPMFCNKTA